MSGSDDPCPHCGRLACDRPHVPYVAWDDPKAWWRGYAVGGYRQPPVERTVLFSAHGVEVTLERSYSLVVEARLVRARLAREARLLREAAAAKAAAEAEKINRSREIEIDTSGLGSMDELSLSESVQDAWTLK